MRSLEEMHELQLASALSTSTAQLERSLREKEQLLHVAQQEAVAARREAAAAQEEAAAARREQAAAQQAAAVAQGEAADSAKKLSAIHGEVDACSSADIDAIVKSLLEALPRLQQAASRRREAEAAEGTTCVVCLDAPRSHVLTPCGHRCICEGCVNSLPRPRRCPVCRADIKAPLRTFG